jgi:hypothetical protein
MSAHKVKETQEEQYCVRRDGRPLSEAEIDYNVMGTFPASDPPSWTLGIERRKDMAREYQGEKPSAVAPSHQNENELTPSA